MREVSTQALLFLFGTYLPILLTMPRRKQGTLLPLELEILDAGLDLQRRSGHFHGFLLAKKMQDAHPGTALTAHGTLYKALGRLARLGLLEASWEDPAAAEGEARPRRRLYTVTGAGERVLAEHSTASLEPTRAVARVRHA